MPPPRPDSLEATDGAFDRVHRSGKHRRNPHTSNLIPVLFFSDLGRFTCSHVQTLISQPHLVRTRRPLIFFAACSDHLCHRNRWPDLAGLLRSSPQFTAIQHDRPFVSSPPARSGRIRFFHSGNDGQAMTAFLFHTPFANIPTTSPSFFRHPFPHSGLPARSSMPN